MCQTCDNGCLDIISDKCVKYSGENISFLGILKGDSLFTLEKKITDYLAGLNNGSNIVPTIPVNIICNLIKNYLPVSGVIDINKYLEGVIKAICSLQTQVTNISLTPGPTGPQGLPGENGKTILNGIITPSSILGTVGDFYINTVNSTLFGPKTSQGWGTGISLIGPIGPQGPAGTNGVDGVSKIVNGNTTTVTGVGTISDPYKVESNYVPFFKNSIDIVGVLAPETRTFTIPDYFPGVYVVKWYINEIGTNNVNYPINVRIHDLQRTSFKVSYDIGGPSHHAPGGGFRFYFEIFSLV
jgi:hypothetical protein